LIRVNEVTLNQKISTKLEKERNEERRENEKIRKERDLLKKILIEVNRNFNNFKALNKPKSSSVVVEGQKEGKRDVDLKGIIEMKDMRIKELEEEIELLKQQHQ